MHIKEKLLECVVAKDTTNKRKNRKTSVPKVHYQLASPYGPVHLSLFVAEEARQVCVNPDSDDGSVQSPASSSEHSVWFSPLIVLTEPANQEMTCHFNQRLFPTYSASTQNLFLFQLYWYLRRDTQKDSLEVEAAAVLWQFPVESLIFQCFGFFFTICN